jgi:hypothetical protein
MTFNVSASTPTAQCLHRILPQPSIQPGEGEAVAAAALAAVVGMDNSHGSGTPQQQRLCVALIKGATTNHTRRWGSTAGALG